MDFMHAMPLWKRLPVLLAFLLAGAANLTAQETKDAKNRVAAERYILADKRDWSPSQPYYLVSWEAKQPEGIQLTRQLDESNGIIRVRSQAAFDSLQSILNLRAVNNDWKLSLAADLYPFPDRKEIEMVLTAHDLDGLLSRTREKGIRITAVDRLSSSLLVKVNGRQFREELLPLPELQFADIRVAPVQEISIIGYNRSFHGLSAVDYRLPGVNGKNIVVGIKEQRMQDADLDLYKRVLSSPLAATTITPHATVVSSIIGGAGNSFYDGRGIAWGCRFFPSSFDNLFADDPAVLAAGNVTVQNHSYGTVIQPFYGAEAASYDALCRSGRYFVQVFSAGNQGSSSANTGRYANLAGFANITGNFKMAKNIITVGAIDNRSQVPAESSAGPLYDGRLAPQLTALGPNGTSDAAALVSGTAAVMQQVYADSNANAIPEASLVKAVLYNSADDIHTAGIDYKTGYGLLNSYEAIKTIQEKRYDGGSVAQGQEWTRSLTLPAGIARLQVTLSWTDSAATVNNLKALINDLDLELVENTSGTVYKPWVLNSSPQPDSLNKPATRQRDSLNTAEQISITRPAAGTYTVRVNGFAVSGGAQTFHVAFRADTLQTFRFVSPQHTSDVNRDEQPVLDVRWQTYVSDTNETGNLRISYNGGSTWELVRAGQKLHTGYYAWPVKDTASRALFRMETAFGNFQCPEFVISRLTRPQVDFLCQDSAGLSWQPHIYAGSYRIYALTDSAYLKPLYTVSDTFTVLHRSRYPYQVYAVEPLLANGLPAARSVAADITLQGTRCFFRTLYYTMQDGNLLDLMLEISAPAYTDSVSFEMVTLNGQWLTTTGTYKTGPGYLYGHRVSQVPQGTSYWRARIRLKSGIIVYSDIISVLSSGPKKILFYPNPLRRGDLLSWSLQQGVPASSGLQLFDVTGRLLAAYDELPVSIDTRSFTKGLILYSLLGPGGQLLETGKLLLQ